MTALFAPCLPRPRAATRSTRSGGRPTAPRVAGFRWLAVAAACLPLGGAAAAAEARSDDVPRLIEQLGSESYAERRRAEEQLILLGPDAFDALKRSEQHRDLEVAARVRHILHAIRVAWVRRGDSAEVRQALSRFDELADEQRLARIGDLAALDDGGAALARIARFDNSPLVAREAALQVLRLTAARHADAVDAELGSSDRLPVQWIRAHLAEAREEAAAEDRWRPLAAIEVRLFREQTERTERRFVEELLRRQLAALAAREQTDAMLAAVAQWLRIDADDPPEEQTAAGLFAVLEWTLAERRWLLLEPLERQYEPLFAKYRILRYLVAEGYRRQDRPEEAERRATEAFQMAADDQEQRVRIAEQLAGLGEIDWAVREYRRVIEAFPVIHEQSLLARSEMAVWLHDRSEFRQAADVMGEFVQALDRIDAPPPDEAESPDRRAERGRLQADRDRLVETLGGAARSREQLQAFAARRYFYLACWHESEQRYEDQLKQLKQAIAANEQDADVLIALYRCPAADEPSRADARERIARVSRFWRSLIDDYPDVAYLHNQWAWLIANTEGDFELAVKFSKRSLQLRPDEPSYLDTLARCYYAAGQLEAAVETQRRAVELQPQMHVMRRQLQFFQAELAQRQP